MQSIISLSPSGCCAQLASRILQYIYALISTPIDNPSIVETDIAYNMVEEIWPSEVASFCTGSQRSFFLLVPSYLQSFLLRK